MTAPLQITLPAADYAALCSAVHGSGLPNPVTAILGRATDNGDGTRGLRINPSIAWMLVTNLDTIQAARPALRVLNEAYWSAGGPDTGAAERGLIARAHERDAEILQRSEAA